MKTHILSALSSIIVICLFCFCLSCKKESEDPIKKTIQQIQMDESTFIKNFSWFMNRVAEYKSGKIYKNTEKLPISDALLYIDATLNYKYCFHSARYGNIIYKTIEVVMPVISIEDKTYLVNAIEAVTEAETLIRSEYKNIQKSNKKLVGIRLSNLGIDAEKLTLQLVAYIGYNSPITNPPVSEYKYIRDSESCDLMVQGYGAPNVIENSINYALIEQPVTNQVIFKTHLSEINYEPLLYVNPLETDITDNLCDYQIFYADSDVAPITPETECLGFNPIYPNEIQYYTNSISQIIISDLNQMNQQFHSVYINNVDNNSGGRLTISHVVTLTYGTRHVINNSTYPIYIDSI